jgi:hypothetical protein
MGYKIGLELMCKCRAARVVEVPIQFKARARGRSKLTVAQQFRYLEHLSRLYDFTFPRLSPVVKFLIATGCGWAAGFVVFLALRRSGQTVAWSTAMSYPAAAGVTAAFHFRYVRAQKEFLVRQTPWRDFALISLGEWAACASVAAWLAARAADVRPAEFFAVAYAVATAARYVLRKELMQDIRGLRKELRLDDAARGEQALRD